MGDLLSNDTSTYNLNVSCYNFYQICELFDIDYKDKDALTIPNIRKTVKQIELNLQTRNKFELQTFVKALEVKLIKYLDTINYNDEKTRIENKLEIETIKRADFKSEKEYMDSFDDTDLSTDYMLLPKQYFKDTIKETSDIYKKNNIEFNINRNYSVPGSGSIRQNIKNITTRTQIININSKYRKNNYLSSIFGYNATPQLTSSSSSSPTYIKNNLKVFDSTDFDIALNETLSNVVSLKLYSIAIPITFYNISTSYGNNSFYYKVLEKIRDPQYEEDLQNKFRSEDPSTYSLLILQDGQYFQNVDTEQNIFKVINENPFFSKYFNMKYDIATGKTQLIVFPNVEQFKIVFYRKHFEINDTTFRKLIPGLDEYIDRIKQVKCNANAKSNTTKIDTNLGYILGFRNLEYTEKDIEFEESEQSVVLSNRTLNTTLDDSTTNSNFINNLTDPAIDLKEQYLGKLKFMFSEALVDLFGTKYFVLSVDDFQKNNFNSSILSVESKPEFINTKDFRNRIDSIPISADNACDKNFLYLQTLKNNVLPGNNIESISDLKLSKKLIYSLNAKNKTNEQIKKSPDISDQIARKNILGVIPIKKSQFTNLGEYYTEFGGTLQSNERLYTGPVDINRFNIKLFNDNGQLIDLNNHDWSFSIIVEHQYQY